jgi:predicted Fe-Mo cluster-binding NifX family protein
MKIVVTAVAGDLDAAVDERFGRAPWYLLIDTETGAWSAHPNRAAEAAGGAGIAAARLVGNLGAEAILTANVGPKAEEASNDLCWVRLPGARGGVRRRSACASSGPRSH